MPFLHRSAACISSPPARIIYNAEARGPGPAPRREGQRIAAVLECLHRSDRVYKVKPFPVPFYVFFSLLFITAAVWLAGSYPNDSPPTYNKILSPILPVVGVRLASLASAWSSDRQRYPSPIMDGQRFDAWEWVMWLLLCFLGLTSEVAVSHTEEAPLTGAFSVEMKQAGAIEQDVQVAAVDILGTVPGLLRSSVKQPMDRGSNRLDYRSSSSISWLSADRGKPHITGLWPSPV